MTIDTDGWNVRPAQAAEATELGSLIADAFHHLEVASFLVADPDQRRSAMGGQFGILVGHMIVHGDVLVVDDTHGAPIAVAAWLRPGEVPDIERYDERLAEACGRHAIRFAELDALMHDAHPSGPEHAYLAFLAVHQARQGRGIGSVLLGERHARLDEAGVPAYLEASSPRSRALYLRHGYVDSGPVYGLNGGKHFYPMWRDPA